MRRPSKDSSTKLSADSQRLSTLAQAVGQAASRLEERSWERALDNQLHKLLKTGHQDTVDAIEGSHSGAAESQTSCIRCHNSVGHMH